MERSKINEYCQFCLKLQTEDRVTLQLTNEIKTNFYTLTSKQLDTSRFSDFICCYNCLEYFEALWDYRSTLLRNQQILEELYVSAAPEFIEFSVSPLEIKLEDDFDIKKETEKLDNEIERKLFGTQHFLNQMKTSPNESKTRSRINYKTKKLDETLQCSKCPRSFNFTSSLEKHLETIHRNDKLAPPRRKFLGKVLDEPLSCTECHRDFLHMTKFNSHMRNVHPAGQPKVCQFCGKTYKNQSTFLKHLTTHEDYSSRKLVCDICSKRFTDKFNLLRHKVIHLAKNERPYKCTICPKTFTQSTTLSFHLNIHNNIKFTCDHCGSSYSEKRHCQNHIKKCMNGVEIRRRRRGIAGRSKVTYKCFVSGCSHVLSCRQQMEVHLEKVHQMRFENFASFCMICQLQLQTNSDYIIHFKSHTCNFPCPICKSMFKSEKSLEKHMTRHKDGEERPFICVESGCGAKFKKIGHLTSHRQNIHTREKPFQCDFCEYKCGQRFTLNSHLRKHSQLRPFKCWICNNGYNHSTDLRKHMKLLHEEARMYSCKLCQKAFVFHKELAEHSKEH